MAVKLADWICQYQQRDRKSYLKLVFYTEVWIINIAKLTIVFVISLLTGTIVYTIAALVGFNFLRRSAHGLHAKNGTVCTLGSIVLFVALPYILSVSGFTLGNYPVILIYGCIVSLLFLFAPADTESIPLVGRKKRAKLRRNAVISGAVMAAAVLLIPVENLKIMLTLGSIYEVVSILPVSYKILGRRYRNYESYEQTA